MRPQSVEELDILALLLWEAAGQVGDGSRVYCHLLLGRRQMIHKVPAGM